MQTVTDRAHLAELIATTDRRHYVYILHDPEHDGEPCTPFYVGIGQGFRLFAHEEEAKSLGSGSQKVQRIHAIWARGQTVVREVDGFFEEEPWDREEQLIKELGRVADGTGPLTNAQVYAPSSKVAGVETRKYAGVSSDDPHAIPRTFKLTDTRIMAGPAAPRSRASVFGKIYTVAEAHPGVTGSELIELLQSVDFSRNKSAYTQSGRVCSSWLAGYIEGAYFRRDRLHLQRYESPRDERK